MFGPTTFLSTDINNTEGTPAKPVGSQAGPTAEGVWKQDSARAWDESLVAATVGDPLDKKTLTPDIGASAISQLALSIPVAENIVGVETLAIIPGTASMASLPGAMVPGQAGPTVGQPGGVGQPGALGSLGGQVGVANGVVFSGISQQTPLQMLSQSTDAWIAAPDVVEVGTVNPNSPQTSSMFSMLNEGPAVENSTLLQGQSGVRLADIIAGGAEIAGSNAASGKTPGADAQWLGLETAGLWDANADQQSQLFNKGQLSIHPSLAKGLAEQMGWKTASAATTAPVQATTPIVLESISASLLGKGGDSPLASAIDLAIQAVTTDVQSKGANTVTGIHPSQLGHPLAQADAAPIRMEQLQTKGSGPQVDVRPMRGENIHRAQDVHEDGAAEWTPDERVDKVSEGRPDGANDRETPGQIAKAKNAGKVQVKGASIAPEAKLGPGLEPATTGVQSSTTLEGELVEAVESGTRRRKSGVRKGGIQGQVRTTASGIRLDGGGDPQMNRAIPGGKTVPTGRIVQENVIREPEVVQELGVANADSIDIELEDADGRLRVAIAKESQRVAVQLNAAGDESVSELKSLEGELRDALEENGLSLEYFNASSDDQGQAKSKAAERKAARAEVKAERKSAEEQQSGSGLLGGSIINRLA